MGLLTIALTLEVLFLGLTVTVKLGEAIRSNVRLVGTAPGLALRLPVGV